MKLIDLGHVKEVILINTEDSLKLRSFEQYDRTLRAPNDYTTALADKQFVIDKIDALIPIRIEYKEDIVKINPMGFFNVERSPKSFRVQVHSYPGYGVFLKFRPNIPEGKYPYQQDALIEKWFAYATSIFKYIPVAIFGYPKGQIKFLNKTFGKTDELEEYWNKQIKEDIFTVTLEVYGLDTGVNAYEIVTRKDLIESFVKFVEYTEEVLGKPHHDWLVSNWSIPVKLFKQHVEENYPKLDKTIIENQDVDVANFQQKIRNLKSKNST
jgi:hypothetical protein